MINEGSEETTEAKPSKLLMKVEDFAKSRNGTYLQVDLQMLSTLHVKLGSPESIILSLFMDALRKTKNQGWNYFSHVEYPVKPEENSEYGVIFCTSYPLLEELTDFGKWKLRKAVDNLVSRGFVKVLALSKGGRGAKLNDDSRSRFAFTELFFDTLSEAEKQEDEMGRVDDIKASLAKDFGEDFNKVRELKEKVDLFEKERNSGSKKHLTCGNYQKIFEEMMRQYVDPNYSIGKSDAIKNNSVLKNLIKGTNNADGSVRNEPKSKEEVLDVLEYLVKGNHDIKPKFNKIFMQLAESNRTILTDAKEWKAKIQYMLEIQKMDTISHKEREIQASKGLKKLRRGAE